MKELADRQVHRKEPPQKKTRAELKKKKEKKQVS